MDLLTISMNRMSLWVYRINGERVYAVNNRSPITDIAWRPDGQSFALMGIDGGCKIYDSNTGHLVHVIPPRGSQNDAKPLAAVGSAVNITQTINWSVMTAPVVNDSIFGVEISTQLPALPTAAGQSTSKVMVDAMDTPPLDFLVIVDANETLSLTFHNIFTVDSIEMPRGPFKYIGMTAKDSDRQFFLTESVDDGRRSFAILQMNLNLERNSEANDITLQSARILALLGYLEETFEALALADGASAAFINMVDLYLSNYKECIYEDVDLTQHFPTPQEGRDRLTDELYQLVVTNLIDARHKDFWLNQFGDRAIKRLTIAGNAAYDLARKVGYTQVVLPLEKLITVLSRLQGLCQWLDSQHKSEMNQIGISTARLACAVELAGDLIKRTYQFIWDCNEEQRLFNFFMDWVDNVVVQRLSKEDEILSTKEDKFLELNGYQNSDVMTFIDEHLFSSCLMKYIEPCKEYEVVRSAVAPAYLSHAFQSLQLALNAECLAPVRRVIKQSVTFDDAVALPAAPQSVHQKFRIIGLQGFVVLTEAGTLTIVSFAISDLDALEMRTIDFGPTEHILHVEVTTEAMVLTQDTLGATTLHSFTLDALGQYSSGSAVASASIVAKRRIFESAGPVSMAVKDKVGCLLAADRKNYTIVETTS